MKCLKQWDQMTPQREQREEFKFYHWKFVAHFLFMDKVGIINTLKRKSKRRNVANLMDDYNGAFI